MAPLVPIDEVDRLRVLLGDVAMGHTQVIQAGDCAEDPADCEPNRVRAKLEQLDTLGALLRNSNGVSPVRVGRIAGQFAKPRTKRKDRTPTGQEVNPFLGHGINAPELTVAARRPDPERMLGAYFAAWTAMGVIRQRLQPPAPTGPAVWTSHEALNLDYELPLIRSGPSGDRLVTSTHWPWIGDRTRQPRWAHVQLMAAVANPIAVKIGPSCSPDQLRELCEILDPNRRPGRLTLTVRLGAQHVQTLLPALVKTVKAAGHPVVWLCDPMHGNTVKTGAGVKTRHLSDIRSEVTDFRRILDTDGVHAGGLHLETSPDEVTECLGGGVSDEDLARRYTTTCDPRLNPEQAELVVGAWLI